MNDLYALQRPSAWAKAPTRWSHSTLAAIATCPRRWQLVRSEWGGFKRFPQRQHPSTIKGIIIHDGLDRLARACGGLGMPTIGSSLFREAVAVSGFFAFFPAAVEEWNRRLRAHPRHGPKYTLRVNPGDLANLAIRQFREQYHPKDGAPGTHARKGASTPLEPMKLQEMLMRRSLLSEVALEHPSLPFTGKVDRIQLSACAVEIVDFKSGAPKPDHKTQLERYAMLWWRNTGVVPAHGVAQYLDTRISWPLAEADLVRTEAALAREIESAAGFLGAHPAAPKVGQSCRFCPVRARCTEGWAHVDTGTVSDGNLDLEVKVVSEPGSAGFLAKSRTGRDVAVVHNAAIRSLLPAVRPGDVIRVVGGRGMQDSKELEIKAWTEVYLVNIAN